MARPNKFGLGLLLLLAWGLNAVEPIHLTGETMGTTWSVKVVSPGPTNSSPARLRQRIQARLDKLEQAFSTYRADSEVSRFNQQGTTNWFPVSADTAAVAAEARRVSQRTDGAFDITIGPLVEAWGFGPQRRSHPPTATEIAAAQARLGWRQLHTRPDPPALRKERPDLALDLSGLAKGYAVDVLSADLRRSGLTNHLVQIAGEFFASGLDARGEAWPVGIEDAAHPGQILRIVRLRQQALSSSGNYRNQHLWNGRVFGHLLDPRTGHPVDNELAGTSVIAGSGLLADAWASALFVLGEKASAPLLRPETIETIFIRR